MPEQSVFAADIAAWLRELSEPGSDPVLQEMHELASERGFPIVGPEVGRLLSLMARQLRAQRIFEMGSGFGYSTLWFARAITGEHARVYHTDGDARNSERARSFLQRAGVADRVIFLVGDARELLASTDGEFDIIFCDIDKHQYPAAYELIKQRVRVGGVAITDNLIWSGRTARGHTDAASAGIREYIHRMWSNPDFLSCLLPLRDGVGLSLRLR